MTTVPELIAASGSAPHPDLDDLRKLAASCTACDLHAQATQTVFGAGSVEARLMLVGEQPGDREDIEGSPFVGPAGQVLDHGLEAVGIDRREAYVTNVVKHFKWRPAGRIRLHQKPNAAEINACRPWLESEIALVQPEVVVCLGATAAQALLGSAFRVTKQRGQWASWDLAPKVTATVHPSSILRAPDEAARAEAMEGFVADLRFVADALRR
jgi:uracil-DNA glycosylase family protein